MANPESTVTVSGSTIEAKAKVGIRLVAAKTVPKATDLNFKAHPLHANQPFGNIDKKPYPTDRSRNGGGYESYGSQPPKARSGVALENHEGPTKT